MATVIGIFCDVKGCDGKSTWSPANGMSVQTMRGAVARSGWKTKGRAENRPMPEARRPAAEGGGAQVTWWDQIMANDFHPDPDHPGQFITDSGMRGMPAGEEVDDDE